MVGVVIRQALRNIIRDNLHQRTVKIFLLFSFLICSLKGLASIDERRTSELADFIATVSDLGKETSAMEVLAEREDITIGDLLKILENQNLDISIRTEALDKARSLIGSQSLDDLLKILENQRLYTSIWTEALDKARLLIVSMSLVEKVIFFTKSDSFKGLRPWILDNIRSRAFPSFTLVKDALGLLETNVLVSFILVVRNLDLEKKALEILFSRMDVSLDDFTRIFREERLHKDIRTLVASKLPMAQVLSALGCGESENNKIKNCKIGESLDFFDFLTKSKRSQEEDLQSFIDAIFNYVIFLINSNKGDLNVTTRINDLTISYGKFDLIIRKSHVRSFLLNNNENHLSKTKELLEQIKSLLLMLTDHDIFPGLTAELRPGLNEFNQIVASPTSRQPVLLESKAIFKIYTCAGHGLISLRTLDEHRLIGLYPSEDTGDQYDRAIRGRIANEWEHYKLGKLAQCQRLVIPLNEGKLLALQGHISGVKNNMESGSMKFSFIGGLVSASSILERVGYKACSGCFNCVQFAQSCFEVVAPNAGNFMHHTRNMIIYALRDRFDKAAFSNLYSAFGSVYSGYRLALEWSLLNLGYSPRVLLAPDLVDYYIPE